jgi:hypothetical protein
VIRVPAGERDLVIREELIRLLHREERHRRLAARLLLALGLTALMFLMGSALMWVFEHGRKAGDIHSFGDAAFFVAAQLLTVSSSMRNPLSAWGRAVDVVLEAWAVFVITAVAGSFAAFFRAGDAT